MPENRATEAQSAPYPEDDAEDDSPRFDLAAALRASAARKIIRLRRGGETPFHQSKLASAENRERLRERRECDGCHALYRLWLLRKVRDTEGARPGLLCRDCWHKWLTPEI